jgi:hypothetical protein
VNYAVEIDLKAHVFAQMYDTRADCISNFSATATAVILSIRTNEADEYVPGLLPQNMKYPRLVIKGLLGSQLAQLLLVAECRIVPC